MKRSMRGAALLAAVLVAFSGYGSRSRAEETANGTPEVSAESAILIEAATGTVLYEKNADEPVDMAGAVKIMSGLLVAEALESGTLQEEQEIAVSGSAAGAGGMSAFLDRGESYPAGTLFDAMMMISANDACLALAEAVSGSAEGFVQAMNERARALSVAPVFVNPTGHNAEGQAMTAREAAIIARELAGHARALEAAKVYSDTLVHSDGRETELVNPNRLVRFYSGCDGLATGSNSTAGYSGVFTAEREGERYIAVVAGARNSDARSADAQALLDYAFANFETVVAIEEGKGVARDVAVTGGRQKTVHGVAAQTCRLVVPKGSAGQITKEVTLFGTPEAPVARGAELGELTVKMEGEVVARVPVVAVEAVEKATVLSGIRAMMLCWIGC